MRQTGSGDVTCRELGGARLSFDPDDLAEAARERNGEQTDPTVEVDGQTRCRRRRRSDLGGVAERLSHQRVEHEWVDLKEAVGVVLVSLSGDRRVDRQRLRELQRRRERDAVVAGCRPQLGGPLRQPSRVELLAQLPVSLGQRGNDERVFRKIDHPASPRLEVAERQLIGSCRHSARERYSQTTGDGATWTGSARSIPPIRRRLSQIMPLLAVSWASYRKC